MRDVVFAAQGKQAGGGGVGIERGFVGKPCRQQHANLCNHSQVERSQLKRCFVEGRSLQVEEDRHERGQTAAQRMACEGDLCRFRVSGLDLQIVINRFDNLRGRRSHANRPIEHVSGIVRPGVGNDNLVAFLKCTGGKTHVPELVGLPVDTTPTVWNRNLIFDVSNLIYVGCHPRVFDEFGHSEIPFG